jgi:uncharacterized protein (PEP-CTERM system associated)
LIGLLALAGGARAEKWTASASAGATETYNHYTGATQANDGSVTSLTGSVNFDGEGARLRIAGTLTATEIIYPGQTQNNSFAPTANVAGHLEAIERFFFVDAAANVSQTYISPFGPQPGNITTPTANRYTTETYSVSPYIKGNLGSNVSYQVRDDSAWTTSSSFGDSSLKAPGTYWNNFDASMNTEGGPGTLSLQYTRQYYDSGSDTGTYIVQVARAIASFAVDPQLEVSARGGYEMDHFPAVNTFGNDTQGSFYGVGLHWRPTERTDLNGFWENHFYGSNYSWILTHRLPNVALSASFTRGLSSFPQIALAIPAGVTVAQFLDLAFTTRIPDPVQRAQAVAQFLAQTGLPPTLVSPLNFYATSLTLQNSALLSAVWVGALNSVAFSLFRTESQAVSGQGSGLPAAFQFAANSIQTGGGVGYSHRLSGLTNFIANASYTRTEPNTSDETLSNARTNNYNASVALSTQFSPKTSGSIGISYFLFDTPGSSDIGRQSTTSVYASISHTF